MSQLRSHSAHMQCIDNLLVIMKLSSFYTFGSISNQSVGYEYHGI